MTEIFEEEEKVVSRDDETLDDNTEEEGWVNLKIEQSSDARRRLEDLLDERRLRDELDDYFENEDLN
ncbi:MAG: hypothetical protein EBQ95_02905 [Gammaproteobacteria bacterium]|nr:hypothetical protein [Gammaproteobacteria bacterium]